MLSYSHTICDIELPDSVHNLSPMPPSCACANPCERYMNFSKACNAPKTLSWVQKMGETLAYQRSDHCHMSSSLLTISSSESTFVPPRFFALFLSSFVTNRPGVTGVIGVKGWYALYGVDGTPVLGAGCRTLSRLSR